jgi:indolepyruvate ferredoxin oxidoreductase beta subunit
MTTTPVCNIRIAGLGGMGIIKSSQILAAVLFQSGYDVKKAEVHGMSQRGGSVASDIRFGTEVLSPMIPDGETDYLLILSGEEIPLYGTSLRPGGVLIGPSLFEKTPLPNKKSLNIAMLGALSYYLNIPVETWTAHILAAFPEKLHAVNLDAFQLGLNAVK